MLTKFWATVCKRVRPGLSDSCLSSLPVTLVYWGQTVGWIKMPHCVRWWPSSPHGRGTAVSSYFSVHILWPNGRPSQQLLSSCYFLKILPLSTADMISYYSLCFPLVYTVNDNVASYNSRSSIMAPMAATERERGEFICHKKQYDVHFHFNCSAETMAE